MKNVTGYAHPDYAASLSEFGTPRPLSRSGGWILERQIQGHQERDAIGCYPLFVCQSWSELRADLDDIGGGLVSLALVTDPFGAYDLACLRSCFPDKVVPFKQHFVVDLSRPWEAAVHKHHQRNARKALQVVDVELCFNPSSFLDEWNELYANLVSRRNVSGLVAFSKQSFAKQLEVSGLVMFRAAHKGKGVGMLLWYVHDHIGYYHLGAYNEDGYRLRASFALFWRALEHFSAQRLVWLDLGAGAGLEDNHDGLTRFKSGWSNGTRMAYLCGRIFDRQEYQALVEARNISTSDYFPAYRKGEFG